MVCIKNKQIIVGLTERHGVYDEIVQFPPPGIRYLFLKIKQFGSKIFKSPIKGYMSIYDTSNCDIVESIMSPIVTKKPWVYSLAIFQEAMAWDILGFPTPKFLKKRYLKFLLLKDNCKRLIFWSHAGKKTLMTYGQIKDKKIWEKVMVVYPAIRYIPDEFIKFNKKEKVNILFSGTFFIKGGVHVIDAFERAQKIYKNICLRLCCDEKVDFNTPNNKLRKIYLKKIKSNPNIILGRVKRSEIFTKILPNTDIYLLPTYADAFGFAILEAMAFGIPVVATNYMAIPEMIYHGENGFLIDISKWNFERLFKGCIVRDIPQELNNYLTEQLFEYMCTLIESLQLRQKMGKKAVEIARSKFSFERRNNIMREIYEEAMN